MAYLLTTVWGQGPLCKLNIENLTDHNHLKPRSSHFFLHTSWQTGVTITSLHIFPLREYARCFPSLKFPRLPPHYKVQILCRWPELKYLNHYISIPMHHWREIPKSFFLAFRLTVLIPPDMCFIHVWKQVGVHTPYQQHDTEMYFVQVIAKVLLTVLANLCLCEAMSQEVFPCQYLL